MGEQGEQNSGRNGAGASEDPATTGSTTANPAEDGVAAASPAGSPAVSPARAPVGFDEPRRGAGATVRFRRALQKVFNGLAAAVRLVAALFAVILLVRIGLAFVAVNPHNVIVEWVVRVADVLVWNFRDLFVPADPLIGLVANYGLAAVFWVVVGAILAWLLSGVGRLVAGRNAA
jgi:hypothetical protein